MSLSEQRAIIERFLRLNPVPLSAFSFASLFLWEHVFRYRLEIIDGCLCILAQNELGTFQALPPLGEVVHPETIEKCFHLMAGQNGPVGVTRIENVPEAMMGLFPPDTFKHFPKGQEYCYARENLAALRGNACKSQRGAGNQFRRKYRYQFLPYEPSMAADCLALYDRWALEKRASHNDSIFQQMIDDSRGAFARAAGYAREIGLTGRVVIVDGVISACTFGYPVTGDVFCVAFEVTDVRMNGLASVIFQEFCADPELAPFPVINTMDDFGLENVARAKESYHPVSRLVSYAVSKKDSHGQR